MRIGGKQAPYPGFNGQIANIAVKFGPGAFVNDYNSMMKHLHNRCPHPLADDDSFRRIEVVKDEPVTLPQEENIVKEIQKESKFAHEYSVVMWAKQF